MRKTIIFAMSAVSLTLSAPAWAKSPIDGTWKADVKSTQLEEKPIVIELSNGVYHCRSCVPTPVSVKADGQFHAVTGQPYYDKAAVKVVDARTVKTIQQKNGKVVSEQTNSISEDGKTATYSWSNVAPDGSNQSGKSWRKRVSAGATGSHAITGSWMTTGYDNLSDNAITVTFKVEGDMLHMKSPAGESYVAKIDGPEAPLQGDDAGMKVKVRKINATTFEETNLLNGKVVGVTTMSVDPDGKALKAVYENKLRGSKMTYKAIKQ